jgi:hypothetical protein
MYPQTQYLGKSLAGTCILLEVYKYHTDAQTNLDDSHELCCRPHVHRTEPSALAPVLPLEPVTKLAVIRHVVLAFLKGDTYNFTQPDGADT